MACSSVEIGEVKRVRDAGRNVRAIGGASRTRCREWLRAERLVASAAVRVGACERYSTSRRPPAEAQRRRRRRSRARWRDRPHARDGHVRAEALDGGGVPAPAAALAARRASAACSARSAPRRVAVHLDRQHARMARRQPQRRARRTAPRRRASALGAAPQRACDLADAGDAPRKHSVRCSASGVQPAQRSAAAALRPTRAGAAPSARARRAPSAAARRRRTAARTRGSGACGSQPCQSATSSS